MHDAPVSASPSTAPRRPDWTILEVLGWTAQRFTERGLLSPRLDAELLIAFALQLRRIDLYVRSEQLLTVEQLATIREVVRRRQEGESVAYITGEKEFWGLPFRVGPHVLVPRPDTETLVEAALERIAKSQTCRVLDVGTGSGAIAVAIAKSRPQASVWATDASADALQMAKDNAERNGVTISFAEGRFFEPVAAEAPFDVVVSNLPYIPSADIAGLPEDVQREPHLALDGGPDGLALIRQLVAEAPPRLAPGGWLLLELGQGQAPAVAKACSEAGLQDVQTFKDLAGIERVVGARNGQTADNEIPAAEGNGAA